MSYSHPVSHASLRALLAIVDSAVARTDSAMLENVYDLIPPLDGDVRVNCSIYISGLIESIEHADRDYAIYSEEEITAARLSLEQSAYGDFDEAMHVLGKDLMAIEPGFLHEIDSDVFRPEFFEAADREIWEDLRQVIEKYRTEPSGDYGIEAYQAYRALREYQQKSYGPLLPTMAATYVRRDGKDTEGISIRLAWVDDALNVVAAEPVAELLNEYFVDEVQVASQDEFDETCLPETLGEYELMDVARSSMYRYEL